MKTLLLTLLLIISFTQSALASPWGQYLRNGIIAQKGMESFFPDPEYMKGPWQQNREYVTAKTLSPNEIQEIPVSCKSQKIVGDSPSANHQRIPFCRLV